ncbi:helix-turn-helix DNA binding domain protein [Mycobacterium phage Maroc7]|nr:hypothetical protein SEA_BIGFOOT_60 [Mycobacterium phage Bigfoot]AOZ64106.1 hypothetical protein SEA_CACTUSROSE_68 [Mycobacterium phage CactusRose]AVO23469.1 hypothetical protein SEA_FASCINUS_62 [Mycobacterium phage Fascinus]AXQ64322.1 helix-turn-helix DNA binding domain protein [Mycobacterium phage Maroc7]
MTINKTELRNLIYTARVSGRSSAAIVAELLEKYDITEKPEPEAPIGAVRVRRDDYAPEDAAIYIKVGANRWVGVYTGEVYSKGFYVNDHLPGDEWGDTEVYRT